METEPGALGIGEACINGEIDWLASRKDLANDARRWINALYGTASDNNTIWTELLEAAIEAGQPQVVSWLIENLRVPADFNTVAEWFKPNSFVHQELQKACALQETLGMELWREGLPALKQTTKSSRRV